jgi:hypothetical protein
MTKRTGLEECGEFSAFISHFLVYRTCICVMLPHKQFVSYVMTTNCLCGSITQIHVLYTKKCDIKAENSPHSSKPVLFVMFVVPKLDSLDVHSKNQILLA